MTPEEAANAAADERYRTDDGYGCRILASTQLRALYVRAFLAGWEAALAAAPASSPDVAHPESCMCDVCMCAGCGGRKHHDRCLPRRTT